MTCPFEDMDRCPLYVASHAGAGCFSGADMAHPCGVRRGEVTFDQAYDEAVAEAAVRLSP